MLIHPKKGDAIREPRIEDVPTKWILPAEVTLSLNAAELRSNRPGVIMVYDVALVCKLERLITAAHENFACGPVNAIYNFRQQSDYGLLDANGIPASFPPGSTVRNYSLVNVAWFERAEAAGMKVLTCSFPYRDQPYVVNAKGTLSDQFIFPLEFGLDSLGHRLEKLGLEGKQIINELAHVASFVHSNFVIVGRELSGRILRLLSEGEERGFEDANVFEPRPRPRPTRTGTYEQVHPSRYTVTNASSKPKSVSIGVDGSSGSWVKS